MSTTLSYFKQLIDLLNDEIDILQIALGEYRRSKKVEILPSEPAPNTVVHSHPLRLQVDQFLLIEGAHYKVISFNRNDYSYTIKLLEI